MSGQATPPSAGTAPTVFLIAAEESGDRLGAPLMRALAARTSGAVRFVGVGGREMEAAGLTTLTLVKPFAFIGFGGLLRHLPTLIRSIRAIAKAAVASRPDVLVIIDSPDFTHRIARIVRTRCPTIPIVNYVSPSVWAWRPSRAPAMRAYIDRVLALLPFEPAAMAGLGGPPCSYVGHPLIEQIDRLRPDPQEVKRRHTDPPLVLVLPGSRAGEIRRLAPIFGKTLALLRERYGAFELVLPTVPHLANRVRAATAGWIVEPRIVVDTADRQAAFRSARAALAKSGTVTLELALAGVPMVTAYRLRSFEAAIMRRLALVNTVILPNLVIGERFVPELLQDACTPENLASALLPLLSDTPERRRQTEVFARFDGIMGVGGVAPSERAADIVLNLAAAHAAETTSHLRAASAG
jgi:lipid-A-disaccharide synthase